MICSQNKLTDLLLIHMCFFCLQSYMHIQYPSDDDHEVTSGLNLLLYYKGHLNFKKAGAPLL